MNSLDSPLRIISVKKNENCISSQINPKVSNQCKLTMAEIGTRGFSSETIRVHDGHSYRIECAGRLLDEWDAAYFQSARYNLY